MGRESGAVCLIAPLRRHAHSFDQVSDEGTGTEGSGLASARCARRERRRRFLGAPAVPSSMLDEGAAGARGAVKAATSRATDTSVLGPLAAAGAPAGVAVGAALTLGLTRPRRSV